MELKNYAFKYLHVFKRIYIYTPLAARNVILLNIYNSLKELRSSKCLYVGYVWVEMIICLYGNKKLLCFIYVIELLQLIFFTRTWKTLTLFNLVKFEGLQKKVFKGWESGNHAYYNSICACNYVHWS